MRTDYLIETDNAAATETVTLLVDGKKALGFKLTFERALGVVAFDEIRYGTSRIPAFASTEFAEHVRTARHRLMCRAGPTHIGLFEPTNPSPREELN